MGDSWTVRFYIHHGWGGSSMEGGRALKLGRQLKRYEADVYLMGHLHSREGTPYVQSAAATNTDKTIRLEKIAAYTGTFLQTVALDQPEHPGVEDELLEGYAEYKGHPPSPTGWIELLFYPKTKQIRLLH